MAAPNKLVLPIGDDDELREHFSRKQPGDTCVLRVTATVDDQIGQSVTLSVKEVEVEEYGEDEGDYEEEAGPAGEAIEPAYDSYYEPTSVPPEPVKKSGTRPNRRSAANIAFARGSASSEQPSL